MLNQKAQEDRCQKIHPYLEKTPRMDFQLEKTVNLHIIAIHI